jgi:hypothetical protein
MGYRRRTQRSGAPTRNGDLSRGREETEKQSRLDIKEEKTSGKDGQPEIRDMHSDSVRENPQLNS